MRYLELLPFAIVILRSIRIDGMNDRLGIARERGPLTIFDR